MSLKGWPPQERPRERLIAHGAGRLSDAEVLAVLLRHGRRGATAVDLARALLTRFGGVRGLMDAPRERLCTEPGIGDTHYSLLQAALELARRHLAAGLARGEALSNPQVTRSYLTAWLRARDREVFAGLFLDNRHRVVAAEELFQGSIDSAAVHPREVVKRALALNAAAVIVAHNHPSGVAEPSRADEILTRRLHDALALVEVRLLDHFIVGDGEPVSLAERGLV
jgi:DNA repair protein RadC